MADCDCGGSLFSHDPDCATEIDRLDGAGYEVYKVEPTDAYLYEEQPIVTLRPSLTPDQLADYFARLRKANVEIGSMVANGHSTEVERLKGKAQGVALALSYLEEILR